MTSVTIRTVRYPAGGETKLLDVHAATPAGGPAVLLWHGTGPDERDVMAPLAREIATLGCTVLVPDWRSDLPDGGRAHLDGALRIVLDEGAFTGGSAGLVVAGWSAGAGAALGVALHPELYGGWRPAAVVGIAGGYRRPARTTGTLPLEALDRGVAPVSVRLVHGTVDTVVPCDSSRELHRALRAHGWNSVLDEPVTDHAGVLGCAYEPAEQRCRPSADASVLDLGRATARAVAETAWSALSAR